MSSSGPVSGFKPFKPARLALLALAIPVACLVLASFVSIGLLRAMGIGDIEGAMARAARGEGMSPAMDIAAQGADITFEIALLALTAAVAWSREKPWPWTGLALAPWSKTRAFLPFFVLMGAWQVFESTLIEPKFPELAASGDLPMSQPALFLSLITIVVAAPLAEELFFRGFLYSNLRRHADFPLTIVITASFFALLHYGNSIVYPLITLPFGLIAGLARERYGSVRPAIYLHALWNMVAWGSMYFFAVQPRVP